MKRWLRILLLLLLPLALMNGWAVAARADSTTIVIQADCAAMDSPSHCADEAPAADKSPRHARCDDSSSACGAAQCLTLCAPVIFLPIDQASLPDAEPSRAWNGMEPTLSFGIDQPPLLRPPKLV
ncbi:hypothetical protein [Chromobacterium violaceum]|uniref:hypothetical protein n=1 Tax=Chromobacterium violaceum TaxID=536 RepID=UPI00111BD087|nr:hypothetical protein [Chromobacterium violaceum]